MINLRGLVIRAERQADGERRQREGGLGKKKGNETVMTKNSSRTRATRPDRQGQRAACTVRGRGGRLLRRGVLGGRIKWRCEAPRDSRAGHTQARSLSVKVRKPLSGFWFWEGHPTSRAQTRCHVGALVTPGKEGSAGAPTSAQCL